MVVVFFGGIGTYYFKVFQWRHLEDPYFDLLFVEKDNSAELAFFRKKTVPDFVDPAIMQMDRLVKLRKSTKKGTVVPENYEQDCKEVANKLREIMNGAKLRQIPKKYAKEYKGALLGISQIYRSLRSFEDAMAQDIPADKERALKESIEYSTKAKNNLQKARRFFL